MKNKLFDIYLLMFCIQLYIYEVTNTTSRIENFVFTVLTCVFYTKNIYLTFKNRNVCTKSNLIGFI